MKKTLKIITLVFVLLAMIAGTAWFFCYCKNNEYSKTVPSEDLSASETVRTYVEYWNLGNGTGMSQLVMLESDAPPLVKEGDKSFIAPFYFFCDVSCSELAVADQKIKNYYKYYDTAIVTANFSYNSHFNFGDKSLNCENKSVEFYLVRENADARWKIISWSK